jgi:hypothetical protein
MGAKGAIVVPSYLHAGRAKAMPPLWQYFSRLR